MALDLSYNEINHLACDYVYQLLIESKLQKLNLRGNNLGMDGASKIAEALYFSRSELLHLDLSYCNIPYKGLLKVFDSVKHNY